MNNTSTQNITRNINGTWVLSTLSGSYWEHQNLTFPGLTVYTIKDAWARLHTATRTLAGINHTEEKAAATILEF